MVCSDLGDEKWKILNIYKYKCISPYEDFLAILSFLTWPEQLRVPLPCSSSQTHSPSVLLD